MRLQEDMEGDNKMTVIQKEEKLYYKPPLPRIVCDECGASCIYCSFNPSGESAWLVCTGCGKEWKGDVYSAAACVQDKEVGETTNAIRDLTACAIVKTENRSVCKELFLAGCAIAFEVMSKIGRDTGSKTGGIRGGG